MLLIILTGETDLEDGQEGYSKLSLVKFDNGSRYSCNNEKQKLGNYWFYLGPANIVMVYGRENGNTLAVLLSAIRQLIYH
jgi:hypothetical protein